MCCARGSVADSGNGADQCSGACVPGNAYAPGNDTASTDTVSRCADRVSAFTQRPCASQESSFHSGRAPNAASTATHVGAVNSYATPGQFSKRPADNRCYELNLVAGVARRAIADWRLHRYPRRSWK